MATESLQARLTEFERQARGVCIGVNHLALDSERVRQAELLQKIIQLEKDIQQSSAQKSHLPDAVAEIRDDVKNNTSALRYLETISQLENSFTVLTENVTETSVQLSAPKELKDEVHVKKELTGNVKSCWTYVSQLARLSQVHIRNAAEYHQFHHAVNEAEASLKARVRMTEPRNSRALPATLKNCTILANELREHLNHMIHLWGRSGNLLEESRRIVPVHLRLGGVIDGLSTNTESASPVMARMLTSLTGPNYELKEGEEVRVISNKDDQHFWTVQTSNGIVKIPSVCLWISDPDLEAVKRSVILREKCVESWDLLAERSRERLRSYYSCLLNQMAENGDIQYQHKIAMDNFLEDLRGLLLPNDTRAAELSQAIYAFTDRLKMTDISRQRSSPGGVVLREQDIVCMHSPLLRLRDHERQMDHLRAQSELAGTHMTNYLREIDADQKRVDQELSLIDQLQHESQSQLDQLINRVKRWSSRYEHEPNVDSSITNSRISSSLKSSTISDNWTGNNQMYPVDARSPQSIVRETSRLSSRTRSESIPCPVLDAITQIGVTTKTSGTQISDDGDMGRNKIDLCISKRQFMPATIPERKQVRNAITQIGVSKVDAGTQDDYHGYSPKRSVKEVLCQVGQITANASCQTLGHYKLQQTPKKPTLDAIVQSGVITKNNSTQSECITETVVKMDILESQKSARKYSVLDAICQIGQVTQTTGTQIEIENTERNKKNHGVQAEIKKVWQHPIKTTEAACQIGRITVNASTEMSPMIISMEEMIRKQMKKSDMICQIGKVQVEQSTQADLIKHMLRKPSSDVVCQVGSVMESSGIQIDEPHKTSMLLAGTQSAKTTTYTKEIQTDMGFRVEPKFVSKAVNDVICQVGQVNHEVSTQSVEYVTARPAYKDTGIDPIHMWEKKMANDVVTQTGIVHTSKITQAELIQEQPVYVKPIETQDVPITSYKETVDAYQQADLIKHMLRKPSSDVVCQVGSVMESSGIQIDEPHKTSMLLAGTQSAKTTTYTKEIQTDMGFRVEPKFVSKAVNDVICQVGQVNHEVSTQSVEYVTARPAYKDTGIDPIHMWEKKMANDVVTQTGIVHTSKITQAELIQEQPVYVKPIETQDVPITSYKETVDAYQQADLIKHMLRKPSSDVVCQVGSVMESSGIQIDEPHKTSMLLAGTQSAKTTTYTKEIQTDMGFRVEPKFVSKAVNDVICQVGQVNHEVSTQSVEYVTARPAYKDTGIDPIHMWEKKMANDVVTQTGIVHTSKITQAELIQEQPVYVKPIETQDVPITSYKETVDAYQQADLIKHMLRKPSSDVVCQVGSVMESSGIQIDEPHKTSMLLAGTQSAKTTTYTKEIQTDMGFRVEPKFVSKAVNDVICQVGQVNHEVSTQSVEYVTARPAYKDTGIDPIHMWEKKMANDVVTQTGIVHTSKITQAELIQEQPVYVKPIETQDVPITSYKETVDAYQQADLIKHMLRKPSSDVVCQVGSVMESSGIQIDEPHKTSMLLAGTQSAKTTTYTKEIQTDMGFRVEPKFVSKAVNDVICQVGQVNHEVSTQSVEYVTARPAYKDTGIDPIHMWEKKMANDVVTQTGIVHTSKITQAELIQEQPVYVKPIETQDVPITSYKETVDAYQQADLIKHMLRKPSSDVVCQVGSVMESSGIQIDEPHKTSMLLAGTQSAKTTTYTKEIQTDMGFRVEPNVIHSEKSPSLVGKKVQATMRQSVDNTSTQTDPMAQVPTALPKTTFDVVTQSGTIHCAQSVQTIPEERPVFHTVGVGVDHTGRLQPVLYENVQATMRQSVDNTSTQTDPMAQVPTALPKTTFDVVTQSGTIHCAQSVQTIPEERPVFHTADVSVIHSEKSPSLVGKKVQATMRQSVDNTSTQTDPMAQVPTALPKTTFDVVTQSGTIHCAQSVQTIPEERPVFHTADVSVIHSEKSPSLVGKKVQVTMRQSVDNTSTQTDPMAQVPTALPKTTFDVVTQSGTLSVTVGCQAVLISEDVLMKDVAVEYVRSLNPFFSKAIQASLQVESKNIEIQCLIRDKRLVNIRNAEAQFDVFCRQGETQTFDLSLTTTKEGSVQHTPTTTQLINKKLQVTVSQSVREAAAQTCESIPVVTVPTMQRIYHSTQTHETTSQTESLEVFDRQSYAQIKCKTIDIEIQSRIDCKSQGLQTTIEQKAFMMTKETSTQYEAVQTTMINVDIQADARYPVANSYVQTDEGQLIHNKQKQQTNLQTQSGISQKEQASQTLDVQTTVNKTDVSVTYEIKNRQINKKLQATIMSDMKDIIIQTEIVGTSAFQKPRKTTFDVQTQSGSVTINSETQTPHKPKLIPNIKDVSVIHEPHHVQTVNKKLQAVVYPPSGDVCLQTEEVSVQPVKPVAQEFSRAPQVAHKQTQAEWLNANIKTFDIQAQSGMVVKTQSTQTIQQEQPILNTADVSVIHSEKSPSLMNKKLQATIRQSVENTSTQTDPMAQVPTALPKTTFDVVTQSGTIHCAQSVQTIPEERPVFHTADVSVIHSEKSPSLVGKKVQATMRQSVDNTSTQTDPMAQVPTALPKTTFDVVTQSGTIHCAQSVQTIPEERPVFHTADVSVIHSEKSPSLVGKKVQATMRQSVDNTSTQTDPMAQVPTALPKTTFDVVTQSGTIHCAQSVQTIPEERPVFHTVGVGVDHTGRLQPVLYENVQATMRQSVDNTSTQTDPMAQVPTALPKTTFDVVTQSGTIHCAQSVQTIPEERPVFHTADVSVIHSEKSPSLVGKKVQATMRQSVDNTSTQTDPMAQVPTALPKTTFDVVTQSGTIHCAQSVQTIPEERPVFHTADVSVIHSEKSPSLVGKKVQATMRQSVDNTSTQTDPMAQVPTALPKTTFDVVTQSGTIHCAQSVQTIPEERPVFHTVGVGVDHTGRLQPVLYENVQATMRQSVDNTSTQTDPMAQVPTALPKTTFDVVTQSGTIHCAQSVQTIPEERPVFHTVGVGVDHTGRLQPVLYENVQATMRQSVDNTSTQTDPMAQVPTALPKTTFDVVTQSGTIHCAQSVQTIPEERPVFRTVNLSVDHFDPVPIVRSTVSSTMHTLPNTSQSTQTTLTKLADTFCQATLPSTTYDVQIQSGVIHSVDGTQTVDLSSPVELKEMSVAHEKERTILKGKKLQVRCDSIDLGVQTDQITPIVQSTISSTMHTLPNTSQSTQTTLTKLADTFCQATLPSTAYDVQIQSGVIHSVDGTQTVDLSSPVELKEMSVTHEKERTILKGKKLQVRCDSIDLGVQTDQITPIVQSTISSTMHTLPNTSQSTQTTLTKLADTFCQATLPSTTYDVQIQSGVIHSVDGTQTVDLSSPVELKEMSVAHEKERTILKGKKLQVRCDSIDLGVQTDQITPIVQSTISSTMHTLPNTSQSTQTTLTKLADTFCQATLPSTTYDVQIQSGVIHSVDGTQTVDLSSPVELKEMSVAHEKERTILKGKKLQVRCDSIDLGVQTDHNMPTVHLDSKLTQTALVRYTDVSCQYTELTKPSSTSHSVTSRVVSIQTDVPFLTNVRVDQRNKKFQVNLISPSSPKSPTNVASIGTQTSDYRYQDISIEQVDKTTAPSVDAHVFHDSASNVTSTSQAIPKIKIDQECQVKITPQQYQKKLQYGSSFSTLKNTSSQTIQDSCLCDHHKTSLLSSIGVQASNIRPVVTVDTGTQETRPSETSPSPLQVKNKKLQVYPSKLGEQVEEEFIHPQETICKEISTSLTETTQTDECLLKNIECFKCISRGYDKKTIDKDMQSEEKSIRTKQTASSTVKSNYFTRILQMETIPEKPKASDTSDVLKLFRESGYRAKCESKNVQTDTFLLGSIQLLESREVDSVGKISKKTTIIQLEKLTTDKCVDTMPFEKGLIGSQTSYHDIQTSERRNIKLLKETPWSEAQASNVLQDIQYEIRHPQMIDSSGSYSPQQNSVSVSARPTTHMLAHTESTSRNGNGKVKTPYQYLKPDVVSWGVQFAPVTLTGVTQTTESSKHKLTIDSPVNIGVQTDAIEDDYYIKRVVTTIARKGLSSYCRRGPVAKRIVECTDLLTSSLPSNLDEEFDEETTIGPRTTKVTTMQKRGDRRVVHEELLTEDYRERGSSLDSHVAHERFLRETHPQDIDLHGMHEHETDIYTDAEICLQNLLKVWGEQYLLSRLRTIGRHSELSVSLDRSIHTAEKSRLVEAKTQFTSTGNLVSQIRNLENIGTQTSNILLTTRPPHKNKRIQRGRSFISGGTNQPPPTRSGSVVSPLSPTTEELTSHHRQHGITSMQTRTSHPFNLATTTFTETTQEQSTFSIEHTVQTYICPTCGSQASIPVTVHSQIQPQTLPIMQLKDAQSQTRFVGQMTTDDNCTYLPTYLSDEEVIRINQSQKIEDKEFSIVTWHPAEIRDTERRKDSDTSNQVRDEVWVDSPGKLLELKITGVIVPGTSKIISASEAFYRGLLRVVYWDYEKLGPRQSSVDSTVSIPLADAVISKAVRLASDRISTEAEPSLDAKIVWRTPEIQRSRYLVHSIRPDAGQNKHNPINLDVASAIRAGLIDKETGRMLFTHSIYESPFSTDSLISKKGDSSSDQTERLSVREAIVRGFLVAELIEPESSYIAKQSLPFIVPSTSYSHSPTDVDI
ncbi:unnamed protein product [Schistosoma spindalis]|nr:unnamed protein product [Schistosoma spindale]